MDEDNSHLNNSNYSDNDNEDNREMENLIDLLIYGDASIPRKRQRQNRKYKNYRKPSYKIAFIPSIRILRRDIRRKYIDMFTNVMNSHDLTLYSAFLLNYYSPDCSSIHRCSNNITASLNSGPTFTATGLEPLKQLYTMNSYMMPDVIVRISNVKLTQRLHERGSRILANITSEATVLYVPKGNHPFPMDRIQNGFIDPNDFQLEKEPKELKLQGTVAILLDESHRFCRFEFNCMMVNP